MRLPLAMSAVLLCVVPGWTQVRLVPPTDAQVDQVLQQLASKSGSTIKRLEALDWINLYRGDKKLEKAIPALERAIRTDPDNDVRRHAIRTLTHLPLIRQRPCPVVLIEAMMDRVEEVRWEAAACLGTFQEFPPEALPILLRGLKSPLANVRGNVVSELGKLARKDAKLVPVIRDATRDADWDVRSRAYFALYRATDRLDEVLPYLVRERGAQEDARPHLAGKQESLEEKQLRENRNVQMIGAAGVMLEWLETRADDVGGVLRAMLDDKTAADRRAAALFLATYATMNPNMRSKTESRKHREPGELEFFKENSAEVKAARTAQLRQQLAKLGLLGRLKRLAASDPDPAVQRAAGKALRVLETQQTEAKKSSSDG